MNIDKEKLKELALRMHAEDQEDQAALLTRGEIQAFNALLEEWEDATRAVTILELLAEIEELQKAVELHAGYHVKADRLDEVEKELERHKRMLLAACSDLGSIGEALGLGMDDDADTMVGTIAANAQALRCNQEAAKVLAASNKALFDDLVIAAETLRRYEGLHRAKGTDDSLKKAEINAELASRFETTLVQAGHHQGLDIPDFTPGNGNRGRRRAAALGIDYDAAAKAVKIKP